MVEGEKPIITADINQIYCIKTYLFSIFSKIFLSTFIMASFILLMAKESCDCINSLAYSENVLPASWNSCALSSNTSKSTMTINIIMW